MYLLQRGEGCVDLYWKKIALTRRRPSRSLFMIYRDYTTIEICHLMGCSEHQCSELQFSLRCCNLVIDSVVLMLARNMISLKEFGNWENLGNVMGLIGFLWRVFGCVCTCVVFYVCVCVLCDMCVCLCVLYIQTCFSNILSTEKYHVSIKTTSLPLEMIFLVHTSHGLK